MLKGLIFDFDGLIIDTETPIFKAWQNVYCHYGCELPFDLWITTIGSSEVYFDPVQYLHSISHFHINDTEVRQIYSEYETELMTKEKMLPGIMDLIKTAYNSGFKLAIASSSPINWVMGYSIKLGIEKYFHCFATKDEVEFTKPHPNLYLLALNKMNLSHTEVIALEDSIHGIQAARKAGIFSIAIPANLTLKLDFSIADLIISNASDINLMELNNKLLFKWENM
jgi:HAD superfamily hydrolase (TIGR01509 family)